MWRQSRNADSKAAGHGADQRPPGSAAQALRLAALAQGRGEAQAALRGEEVNVTHTQISRKNTILPAILPAPITTYICIVFTLPTRFSCSSRHMKKPPSYCQVTQTVTPPGNQEIISLGLITAAPPQLHGRWDSPQMLLAAAPGASPPPQIQMCSGDQRAQLLSCSLGLGSPLLGASGDSSRGWLFSFLHCARLLSEAVCFSALHCSPSLCGS